MRVAFAIPLLLLGACQVSKDDKNDTTSVEFNQDVAENGVAAAGNTLENVAGAIANDVERTAEKVQNKVGDVNVDVKVDRNTNANGSANKQ